MKYDLREKTKIQIRKFEFENKEIEFERESRVQNKIIEFELRFENKGTQIISLQRQPWLANEVDQRLILMPITCKICCSTFLWQGLLMKDFWERSSITDLVQKTGV